MKIKIELLESVVEKVVQNFNNIIFSERGLILQNRSTVDRNWPIGIEIGEFLTEPDKIISHIKMPLALLPVMLIILVQKIFEISVIENAKLKEMKNFSILTMKLWRLFSKRTQIHQEIIQDLESSGMFMIDQIQLHHHHQIVSYLTTPHTTQSNHTFSKHHNQSLPNKIFSASKCFTTMDNWKTHPPTLGNFPICTRICDMQSTANSIKTMSQSSQDSTS